MLTFNDILQARERLRGVAHRTPVLTSKQFNEHSECEVFFKAENLQRVGAFKFRGAYNKLASLKPDERKRGVLAYSSGNHAQATALAARLFGAPAVIVMPLDAPQIKVAATRAYGAEVIFYDRYSQNREETGERICRERGMTLVPPFDDYAIMAGQGTA
ncbi:MAG: pyridoxal-phosphate dependent enzyme, partial [Blastocatellia bacterium]